MAEARAEDDVDLSTDNSEQISVNYKVPEKKSVEELKNLDQDDESLRRYKESLLGAAKIDPPLPDNPNNVVLTRMVLEFQDHPQIEIDLKDAAALAEAKKNHIVLKEGVRYRCIIYFYVQREIVSGMRYIMSNSRKGLPLGKETFMMGCYAPNSAELSWSSDWDDAPKGMLAHGSYKIKAKFTDDDANELLKWEWTLDIKKDWKD